MIPDRDGALLTIQLSRFSFHSSLKQVHVPAGLLIPRSGFFFETHRNRISARADSAFPRDRSVLPPNLKAKLRFEHG